MFGLSIFPTPQNLSDLKLLASFSEQKARITASILVIDNEDFYIKETLHNRRFNVRKIDDLEDPTMAREYDIIVCDIKGVGKKFRSHLEGAYLAKTIKNLYPHKQVIMYTGSTYEAKYNDVLRTIDGFIEKDANIDQWEQMLSEKIAELSDPVRQWKVLRNSLLSKDVPISIVYRLEQSYIKKFKDSSSDIFPNERLLSGLNPEVVETVKSMAVSLAFKLIGLPNG